MEGYDEITRSIVENNLPWFMLSRSRVEKAQVFSLGLMIYCIFEGVSSVGRSLFHAWPAEPDVEFPSFKRTPLELRGVIRCCTLGASQWSSGRDDSRWRRPSVIERRGSKVFVEDLPPRGPGQDADLEVLDAAKAWWENEMELAQAFMDRQEHEEDRRPTLKELLVMLESVSLP